ncbi:prolipoprotein diacylglyceryl transferase [uncultured Corynebacterium sp.]|uniref:prolipoprotein diacylglyceryl transferase n=1 Tax=uncultured Corynebacterium sp. TaxID=159447 RepID=UPI0025DE5CAF|nr:prolipoprotein diacylglyceryl transferase [uncultured Corynebacterium sp.]
MTVELLANIPSPPQGVWQLGPIPLRGYALSILAGIVIAVLWSKRRYADRGGDPEIVLDVAIAAIPAGIIGGRLYHVMTDWEKYFGEGGEPLQAFNIAAGGLGIWGAVALGTLAGLLVLKWRGVPAAPMLDAVAPTIILAQGIGRLGNWFNQELYGAPTDVPWGLEIYRRVDEAGNLAPVSGVSTGEVLAVVHPTFLYELLWNVAICVLLVWLDRRFRLGGGLVFALYVAGYTLGRFFIELMRTDPATEVFGGLRINTVTSAVVFLIACGFVFALRHRRREAPETVRGDAARNASADAEG